MQAHQQHSNPLALRHKRFRHQENWIGAALDVDNVCASERTVKRLGCDDADERRAIATSTIRMTTDH